MQRRLAGSPMLQVLLWLGSAVLVGGIALGVLGLRYAEFMDCSNPEIHASANTTFGWTVATIASALPVAVAIWLARRFQRKWLPLMAVATALAGMVVWRWALDVDCEWYAMSRA